ncbi:MAG: hypothetical protein NZ730_06655 [Porticoccaceae bacterium]|nr:hypothetical protein [Porticoccaceae bacterium]
MSGAGRPKGSANKNKKFLLSRLQDMYGKDFHPIMKMAENAVNLHSKANESNDTTDLRASIEAWDKIASFTEPKLKALEVSGNGEDGELVVQIQRKRYDGS